MMEFDRKKNVAEKSSLMYVHMMEPSAFDSTNKKMSNQFCCQLEEGNELITIMSFPAFSGLFANLIAAVLLQLQLTS